MLTIIQKESSTFPGWAAQSFAPPAGAMLCDPPAMVDVAPCPTNSWQYASSTQTGTGYSYTQTSYPMASSTGMSYELSAGSMFGHSYSYATDYASQRSVFDEKWDGGCWQSPCNHGNMSMSMDRIPLQYPQPLVCEQNAAGYY